MIYEDYFGLTKKPFEPSDAGPDCAPAITPFSQHDLRTLVQDRLQAAGWQGRPAFAADFFAALHQATEGDLQRVGPLMDEVLRHAANAQRDWVDQSILNVAIPAFEDAAADGLPLNSPTDATSERDLSPLDDLLSAKHPSTTVPDSERDAALARIERRLDDQEQTLRHVLTMLIEWIEDDSARKAA